MSSKESSTVTISLNEYDNLRGIAERHQALLTKMTEDMKKNESSLILIKQNGYFSIKIWISDPQDVHKMLDTSWREVESLKNDIENLKNKKLPLLTIGLETVRDL